MNWTDKVILVTGGAHRVGKAMALRAADLGANVVITYHASSGPAEETCAEISAKGRQALAIQCNQAQVEPIAETVEAVIQHFGRLDGLVNSASVFYQCDFFEITPDEWDEVLNVNTRGPFLFTQAAGRHMVSHEGGVIVNIIDESALDPNPEYPHHTVSKAALWSLTRVSAKRLAPKVRVNAILPGAVLKPPDWTDARWESLIDIIPLRKLGSPEDVCQALEYLLCADFVTGQMIVVEGGATI